MLGACHVMACVLWYVGTYDLPSVAQADNDAAGTDPTSINSALQYQNQRNHTWLGSYSGKSSYSIWASRPLPKAPLLLSPSACCPCLTLSSQAGRYDSIHCTAVCEQCLRDSTPLQHGAAGQMTACLKSCSMWR